MTFFSVMCCTLKTTFFDEKLLYISILKLQILAFNHIENYFAKILVYTFRICVKYYSRYRQSCGSSTSLYICGFHHTSSCYNHKNMYKISINYSKFPFKYCLCNYPVCTSCNFRQSWLTWNMTALWSDKKLQMKNLVVSVTRQLIFSYMRVL